MRLNLEESMSVGTLGVDTLEELIPKYAANKNELDTYKKICDAQNTAIKQIMADNNLESTEVGDYKVNVSTQVRESFNEEKLIDTLMHSVYDDPVTGTHNICVGSGLGIVKMKPYVDMDALESAIFKGLLSENVLLKIADCKETKEVVTLRVTKKKPKKGDNE